MSLKISDIKTKIFIVATVIAIVMIVLAFIAVYKFIKFYDEIIQVDGEIIDKGIGYNYWFVLKENDGNIIMFSVDFDEYHTYEINDYYTGKIRRKNIIND